MRHGGGEQLKNESMNIQGLHLMGALQVKNRMDTDVLLNPAGESHVLTKTCDQEIYQAIINSISARENIEINGGDDGPVEPRPTHHEVYKVVSIIGKYTNDLNDPLARKIDVLLGSSTRQLHHEETLRRPRP